MLSWSPILDVMSYENITVDLMHTVDLGVCQYYAGVVLSLFLKHDILGTQMDSVELKLEHGILLMQQELETFYALPACKHASKISTLTSNLILGPAGYARPIIQGSTCVLAHNIGHVHALKIF